MPQTCVFEWYEIESAQVDAEVRHGSFKRTARVQGMIHGGVGRKCVISIVWAGDEGTAAITVFGSKHSAHNWTTSCSCSG